ncbi:kinase domain-containing protein [Colletotrichum cereale]|nr:kinase domain-containing protein [Colletotrichum cereale]
MSDSPRYTSIPAAPGGHAHCLQPCYRQKRSLVLNGWRALLGQNGVDHTGLTRVPSWIGSLKRERDISENGNSKQGHVGLLVEKYGSRRELIGRGTYGVVRLSHKTTEAGGEDLFAIKTLIRRSEESQQRYHQRATAEFVVASSLQHRNIVSVLDLMRDEGGYYSEVMEFCAGGDLFSLIKATGKLMPGEADCFFKQLMRSVEFLHEMGVAHRDIKPENILLTIDGVIKITDFGSCDCFRLAWESDARMVSGIRGSEPYVAPEEYTETEFDARAIDVWACGVVFVVMRTGHYFWGKASKAEDELYARYLEDRRIESGYAPIEAFHKMQCKNAIYCILDPIPKRRITASQFLRSEWMREIALCNKRLSI